MLKALVGSFAALFLSAAAQAQDWPTRPVTIYMGFPAGSGVDVVGRLLQPSLEKSLGQRIVIDYKSGAGGNVASETVANAKPDGYTFLLGTAATHGVNAALYKKLPFDVEADFTPISPIVDVPNVLAINPAVIDAKDVQDFIAKVKAAPGKYSYASTGNGTGTHLAFAAFNSQAGLDMVHVPYKGGPDATNSVLKGETCCVFELLQTMIAARQGRQGPAARRDDGQAGRCDAGSADHRRAGDARLRELHLVCDLCAQGPRSGDRRQDERCTQDRDRRPGNQQEARRARQHTALRDPRAVQGHGEARPRQMG